MQRSSIPQLHESKLRIVLVASLIGAAIEWYDFFLCGASAALMFNRQYSPDADPLTGAMVAFSVQSWVHCIITASWITYVTQVVGVSDAARIPQNPRE